MKADYLTLTDGRKVRIEWNMNALATFTSLTGIRMEQLISIKPDVATLRTIAWCSAMEGEAADGNSLEISEVDFGRLMSIPAIIQFSEILARQSGMEQKKSPPPDKPRRKFFTR